ncbi:MAG: ATP-binding cassette domain-containing protein [Bacteroidales bacterium]|nr:ATP-binding cassette domain-containing protein [Bacteroidales bacterium]
MTFFEARNITKKFSTHLALDNVSIHVPKGSIYGLLGPNGAGKTSLIRIINRITAPDSGEVFFDDRPMNETDISRIGYLPEERGLYKKMKVGEQALYLARLKGLSKADAISRLRVWFEKLEMNNWWDKKIEELSKGMAQKVQFIVSMLHEPELLILDEPFSGFDPVNAGLLKQEVLKQKALGRTIILSTHDMASVEELCDYITLINKSKAVLEGKVDDIRAKYKSNKFEIVYSGNVGALSGALAGNYLLEASGIKDNGHSYAIIGMGNRQAGNDLLKLLISVVDIHSFREILPSMNEVFIAAVRNSIN